MFFGVSWIGRLGRLGGYCIFDFDFGVGGLDFVIVDVWYKGEDVPL